MHSKALLSACAFAVAANALTVLPKVATQPTDPGLSQFGRDKAVVQLPCPSCPLAVGNADGHPAGWAQGPDTQLQVELTSDGKQLFFNGMPFYPVTPSTLGQRLSAKQEYAPDAQAEARPELFDGKLALSTGVEIHPAVEMMAIHLDATSIENMVEKVPIRTLAIEVLGLGRRMVRVDTITVRFSEDKLKIHDVRLTPYAQRASPASDACSTVMCRIQTSIQAKLAHWRHVLAHKMHGLKHHVPGFKHARPCAHKNKHAHPHPHPHHAHPHGPKTHGGMAKFGGKFTADGAFRGFRDGGKMTHRIPGHRAFYKVVGFVHHILLPVLIGVAVGMIVSGIGMLIGQFIIFICNRLFGQRAHGYREVEQYEVIIVEDEEDVEILPKYEDVYTAPPQFDEKH